MLAGDAIAKSTIWPMWDGERSTSKECAPTIALSPPSRETNEKKAPKPLSPIDSAVKMTRKEEDPRPKKHSCEVEQNALVITKVFFCYLFYIFNN